MRSAHRPAQVDKRVVQKQYAASGVVRGPGRFSKMQLEQAKRVLVVDDDPEIRRLLAAVLRQRGLIAEIAESGDQALDRLRDNHYSVVLLDLFMPAHDGFALLRKIQVEAPQKMPIVIVVTGADRNTIESLDSNVIHGVIRKPFDPEEVGDLVVACADIRDRASLDAMTVAAVLAGGPLMAWLSRL